MYVHTVDDVRGWIEGGSQATDSTKPAPPYRMPAYRSRLRGREIQDLVAYVVAADGYLVPADGPVAGGRGVSRRYGCESCHGIGGSGGVRNHGSLTGSVAGWIGAEFAELVRSEAEFAEWVRDGRSSRMKRSAAASFFLDRSDLSMPAFGTALSTEEVSALWSYVQWLNQSAGGSAQAP